VAKMPKLQPMVRLPKEPAPEMLRTFGPRPSLEPPRAEAGAGSEPVASPSPSDYRRKNPYRPPPAQYKPPSLLREHRRLAFLFAGAAAVFAVYCLKLSHGTTRPPASASAPAAAPASSATARPSAAAVPGVTAPAAPTGATRADIRQPSAATERAAQVSSAARPIYVESVPDQDSH
jgi:hypothetical protein